MGKLKPGQKAPDFTGLNEAGKPVSLNDFKGRKLIIFFYPKDNTEGCTKEACNLRDNYKPLKKMGFEIIGVSADSARKHRNFIGKYNLPFSLIADTEKIIIEKYGVWGEKKFMGRVFDGILRTTFVVDEDGKISHIIDKVDTANHTEQIIELISK